MINYDEIKEVQRQRNIQSSKKKSKLQTKEQLLNLQMTLH